MEKSPNIPVSVLVTREEYMAFAAQMQRQARRRGLPLTTGCGAVLIALGLAGIFFGSRVSLSVAAAVCMLLLGVFLACYDGLVAPVLDRAAAAREFDERDDLRMANVYVFTEKTVQVRNGCVEGEIPLSLLTRWTRADALFSLSFGRELSLFIPMRLLTAQQAEQLEDWLTKCAPAAGEKRK